MGRLLAIAIAIGSTACLGGIDEGGSELPPPNVDPQLGCSLGCHGGDSSNAPPMSISQATATTAVGVGAHQSHMNIAPTWHRAVQCVDCHTVPAEVGSPGHIDGDNKAEVTFAPIAGPAPMWSGTTCTVACHGSAAFGGAKPTPTWTLVDGSQAACGSCHGAPPPAPHPAGANCAMCHPTMEENSLTFRDPASHINGVIDVVGPGATGGCTACHGSATAAPPKALNGATANNAPGVGAHTAHLATSPWHRQVVCTDCHTVPLTVDAPGHMDGDNIAELKFSTLNPAGVFTKATNTCSNLYCHGTGRANTGTLSWITPGALACGRCHNIDGNNMSGDHRKHIVGERMKCSQCHGDVVDANMVIKNAGLHVNGVHEVKMAAGTWNAATRSCSNTGCHGTERW